MTFANLFIEYGPGFFAGLILGSLPLVLGLRAHKPLAAVFADLVCVLAGTFFSLIGALTGSLAMAIFFHYRGLLTDDETREITKKEAEALEKNRVAELSRVTQEEHEDTPQQIFITACNQTATPLATMLYERLSAMGYAVVTDNVTLTPEIKDQGVYTLLDQSSDIIAVLTPNCLAMPNKLDTKADLQLQEELSYGLDEEKNILCVSLDGFEWPDTMPNALYTLQYTNGALYNGRNLEPLLDRIIYCLSFSLTKNAEEKEESDPVDETKTEDTVTDNIPDPV